MGIAHIALQLLPGHERGHRVDYHDIDRAGAQQRFADFQRLLARIGLGNIKVFNIDAQLVRVRGIQRVFRVDKGGCAAHALGLRNRVQGDGGFTGRFRPEHFDDAAAR